MKKLMIAAAALACGVALADGIESANIVGYSNRSWAEGEGGKFKLVCSQFQTIGTEANDMTLGDLVPAGNWLMIDDVIKVFRDDSGVAYEAFYIDAETAEGLEEDFGKVSVGWYATDDEELSLCLNKNSLPMGTAVMAIAADDGAYITSAGEVVESESGKIKFTWDKGEGGTFKMIGNCTPVNLNLEDFVPGGSWLMIDDVIKIFRDDSGVAFEAFYIDAETAEGLEEDFGKVTVGWYKSDDEELANCLTGDDAVPMAPGDGFMAIAADDGAYIEIPSAL